MLLENLIPLYWRQNNIALSLHTFEINRYDRIDGRLIEEYAGTVSFVVGSNDGGFSTSLMQDSDRGYAVTYAPARMYHCRHPLPESPS